MTDVKIGGQWVAAFGAHATNVTWSTRFGDGPCGPDLATIELNIDPLNDTELLHMGRLVEVWDEGVLRFAGPIAEPGKGLLRTVEANGWPRRAWDAISDPAPGARVGRDVYNRVVTPTAETTPRWTIDAHDLEIGVASDRLFTLVIATYVSELGGELSDDVTDTVTAEDAIAQEIFGELPYPLDLTPLGLIAPAEALGYAQQQLAEFGVPEWTERVTTTPDRLRTITGHQANLSEVTAGQVVHVFNAPTSFGGLRRQAATDVVLSEVSYSKKTPGEITIAPARVAVRSVADTVRQLVEATKKGRAAA